MYRRISTGILASLVLTLAGCQTLQSVGLAPSEPADPRLKDSQSAQFFSRSGFQACAMGALAGAGAGLLSGQSTAGTLAAAAAGCGVGMGANYYLDYQRSKYAKTEDRLDASIADVRKDNKELQSLAKTARQVINDDRRKIAKIRQDIVSKRVKNEEAKKQLAEVDANVAYLKKTLKSVQSKQQEWEKMVAAEGGKGGARLKTLNAEIDRMKKQKNQLEKEVDQLYAQRSAIKLA